MTSRSTTIVAVTACLVGLSFLTVSLRLVSRLGILRKAELDDYCIIIAWLLALGLSCCLTFATSYGMGQRGADIHQQSRRTLQALQYAFTVLYNPALMATKTSLLILFLRMTQVSKKFFRFAIFVLLVTVNLGGCVLTILNIAQCLPIAAAFQFPTPANAKCFGVLRLALASAPLNLITDLCILILPLPIITDLKLPRKQKATLVFVFAIGLFLTVVGVLRIVYLQRASNAEIRWMKSTTNTEDGSPGATSNPDFFWNSSLSFLWSVIEVNVGIMCASILVLKPLSLCICSRSGRSGPYSQGGGQGGSQLASPVHANKSDKTLEFITPFEGASSRVACPAPQLADAQLPARRTFFNLLSSRPRVNMLEMTNKQSLRPLSVFACVFFGLGFAEAFLVGLTCRFQSIVGISDGGASYALIIVYYCGYLIAPLSFGYVLLKRFGFKSTILTGLFIYSCGLLVFWPSAVLSSLPAFILSNLIIGTGISTLEIGSNLFITLCGPPALAEARANALYGVRAMGAVVSHVFFYKFVAPSYNDPSALQNAQWSYFALAMLCIGALLTLYYCPLPALRDEDFDTDTQDWGLPRNSTVLGIGAASLTLGLGVFAQFCCMGSQNAVYLASLLPYLDTNNLIIAKTSFAAGRLIAACLCIIFRPRYIWTLSYLGTIVTCALGTQLRGTSLVMNTIMIWLFMSAIWPTNIAISIRGLGRRTNIGTVLITAAGVGGAFIPPIFGPVAHQQGYRDAWLIPAVIYSASFVFPLVLNFLVEARKPVGF